MKLTEKQKNHLMKHIEDNDYEAIHVTYDDIVHERLKELDPEFIKEIDDLVRDIVFWYA